MAAMHRAAPLVCGDHLPAAFGVSRWGRWLHLQLECRGEEVTATLTFRQPWSLKAITLEIFAKISLFFLTFPFSVPPNPRI